MTRQQKYEAYSLKPLDTIEDWKGFATMLEKKIDQLETIVNKAQSYAKECIILLETEKTK